MLRPVALVFWVACTAIVHATEPPSVKYSDVVKGESLYQRCIACHSLNRNRTGPKHCGVFGRAAAAVHDFEYSDALRRSGIVWTDAALDEFLADPLATVPGTTMGFAGITDDQDRRSIIEYLKYASRELCDGNSR